MTKPVDGWSRGEGKKVERGKNLLGVFFRSYTAKRWFNDGDYCNGVTHPQSLTYRPYRRGSKRCLECGAKLGKSVYKKQSFNERMTDNLFQANPLMAWLRSRGQVQDLPR